MHLRPPGRRAHPHRRTRPGTPPSAAGRPSTVLGLATPYISEDLAPTGSQLLWIGDVYSFVLAGLLVSMGSLGDRVGRKRILLYGAAAFGLISVLNAYAHTPEVMIAARALLGVAGATLMPATLALIRNLSTTRASAASPSASGAPPPPPAPRSARSSAGSCSSTSGGARCS
ncbi:Multidrug resistance protein MdtL [Streptomyces griseoloalbus]